MNVVTFAQRRQQAMADIEECRHIHALWSDWLERGGKATDPSPQGPVGGKEWHDEWVRKYEAVLDVLAESRKR